MPLEITEADFEEAVLQAELPVLLDFWSPTCPPCMKLMPVIEEVAEEFAGRAIVAKINVAEQPDLAGRFGISAVPTLVLIKDGQAVDGVIGAVPKSELVKMLEGAEA